MHVPIACRIVVANEQFVPPLTWNNSLSEITLGESFIRTIYKHLNVKEKLSLDVEGIYNM